MQDAGFQVSGSQLTQPPKTLSTFNVQRHLISARMHRTFRASAMTMWREAVAVAGIIILGCPITTAWALGLLVEINPIMSGSAIVMVALARRDMIQTLGIPSRRSIDFVVDCHM